MKSQLPHRETSKPFFSFVPRLGTQLLGLIAAVAIGKKNWFNIGRRLIGSTWESFSQPHSLPYQTFLSEDDGLLSNRHLCSNTKARASCWMHSRWGSPIFHVSKHCRDAYRTLRQSTVCGSKCGRPTPAPRSQRLLGQGLDLTQTRQSTRGNAPPPIQSRFHLHYELTPRDLPAVYCTAVSFERSSLDLAQSILALLMRDCGGAQRTATCSAYGDLASEAREVVRSVESWSLLRWRVWLFAGLGRRDAPTPVIERQ